MNTTINEQQLSKTAYVYVRQSTLAQVRHHQESTERQYALKEKALQLGWNDSTVQILDRDLGKSGAQITGREDFKTLVAEVSMGQVGAVFALEVSRLARSNLDLASFAGTVCTDRYAGDRRRWLLQPGRFQRRASVGIEGDNGSGRTSSVARAPPWWQAQQSKERRVAFPASGRALLRRRGLDCFGPG